MSGSVDRSGGATSTLGRTVGAPAHETAARPGMSRGGAQVAILAAALLWGASGAVSDAVMVGGFDALDLAFWRLAIGGALFAMHAGRTGGLRLQGARDVLPLVLLGVLVIAGNYVAFGLALEHGGVSLVNLFIATAPGFIAVGAFWWFRERVGAKTAVLVAAGVAGLVLASWGNGTGVEVSVVSIGLGVVTTATVVAYTLGTKPLLDRYSPVVVSAFVMIIGAVALLPFVDEAPRSAGGWLGVVGLGVGATYLASLLYLRGLQVVGATTTGLLVSLEAPIALALAALLIGERFVPVGLVGVGLVLVSSLLVIGRPPAATRRTRVTSDQARTLNGPGFSEPQKATTQLAERTKATARPQSRSGSFAAYNP